MANSVRIRAPQSRSSNLCQIYRSLNRKDIIQPLPSCWSSKDRTRCLKLSHSSLTVTYIPDSSESRHSSNSSNENSGSLRSDCSIPLNTGIYYFETTVIHCGTNSIISIGISTKNCGSSKLPGLDGSSFGYHSDGSIYNGSQSSGIKFGPVFNENDTIGCGVDLIAKSLFFTHNGVFLGKAFEGKIPVSLSTKLFPAIGLQGRGCRTTTNFGDKSFRYPFKRHIKEERDFHENKLIASTSKEFMVAKMRRLVSGYMVHHGYIDSARALSRWAVLAGDESQSAVPENDRLVNQVTKSDITQTGDEKCEQLSISDNEFTKGDQSAAAIDKNVREFQEPACSPDFGAPTQLPGLSSILHRRRLRALCRRCQYGRAVSLLTRLYPQVIQRHPEILVQLRCRQLVEMMHRHSMLRSSADEFDLTASGRTKEGNGQSMTSPHSVPVFSVETPSLSASSMDVDNEQPAVDSFHRAAISDSVADVSHKGVSFSIQKKSDQLRTSPDSLFTGDQDDLSPCRSITKRESNENLDSLMFSDCDGNQSDSEEFGDSISEDDGFGFEGAGVFLRSEGSPVNGAHLSSMEVDSTQRKSSTNLPSAELDCLLRQVQFGRSLMNLVKELRTTSNGLSRETEYFIQQSVSLMAYSKPSSPDCPLRCLLDPCLRDSIASLINSAILQEVHNLPAEPAIEQALNTINQCFSNRSLLEAQTLGHFLLYHLSSGDYAVESDRQSYAKPGFSGCFTNESDDICTNSLASPENGSSLNGSRVFDGHGESVAGSSSNRKCFRARRFDNGWRFRNRRRVNSDILEESGASVTSGVEEDMKDNEDMPDDNNYMEDEPREDEDDDDDDDDEDNDEMDVADDVERGNDDESPYRRGPPGGSAAGSGSSSTGGGAGASNRSLGASDQRDRSSGTSAASEHDSSPYSSTSTASDSPALTYRLLSALRLLHQIPPQARPPRLRRSRLGHGLPTAPSSSTTPDAIEAQSLLEFMLTPSSSNRAAFLASLDEETLKAYVRCLLLDSRYRQHSDDSEH